MSAAATAAGYLYASGRLRGGRRDEAQEAESKPRPPSRRREVKVAVYEPAPEAPAAQPAPPAPAHPKRAPKIEYRTRRWKPE